MTTRFDCPFLAKILRKFITRTINLRTKMTTVLRFSRHNESGLRVLDVFLWGNLLLEVVLALDSKAL